MPVLLTVVLAGVGRLHPARRSRAASSKDHLGSVRRVVNAQAGAIVHSLDDDAFGRVLGDTTRVSSRSG